MQASRLRENGGIVDNLTKEQRVKSMRANRGFNTGPEMLLRRALWGRGHRGYRLNVKKLPGRPDLSWRRHRLAVFVDGAFWHGHPSAFTLGKSGAYWDEKIGRNMERDRAADAALAELGWRVVRYWDFEIRKELERCVGEIEELLKSGPR